MIYPPLTTAPQIETDVLRQSFAASVSDIGQNLRELQVILTELEEEAKGLELCPERLPDAYEPMPLKDKATVEHWSNALLYRYEALNAVIWPAEQRTERLTDSTAPIRELGLKMWSWHHLHKCNAVFPLRQERRNDPTFRIIWNELLTRAKQGNKYALEYMRERWGVQGDKKSLKQFCLIPDNPQQLSPDQLMKGAVILADHVKGRDSKGSSSKRVIDQLTGEIMTIEEFYSDMPIWMPDTETLN